MAEKREASLSDLSLDHWLAEVVKLTHEVLVEEPTPEQRKRFGVTGPLHQEYGRVCGPDGEPREGGKRTVFVDDRGNHLVVRSWTLQGSERARVWYALTNAPADIEPGQLIHERYVVMSKEAATKKVRRTEKKGKGEAAHRARMAAKGKAAPKVEPGSTMQRMAERAKERRAAEAKGPADSGKLAGPIARAAKPAPAKPEAAAAGKPRKAAHALLFGKYAYCAASRAIGLRGFSKEDKASGIQPWQTEETAAVLAAAAELKLADRPILPAKGSVSATMRDKRLTPAELTAGEWERLERARAKVNKAAAAAAAPVKKTAAKAANPASTPKAARAAAAAPEVPAQPAEVATAAV